MALDVDEAMPPEGDCGETGQSGKWKHRAATERRSGRDQRGRRRVRPGERRAEERRLNPDRRTQGERREGWLRIGPWRSVSVFDD
jgi:hypothetical protein